MENYSQIKKIERIVGICIFFFVITIIAAIISFVRIGQLKRTNAEYDEFISKLEEKETLLESGIFDREQDDYLRDKARDRLGMIREGETLYLYE